METLEIQVAEIVKVKDMVLQIKELVERIMDFLIKKELELRQQIEDKSNEGRGPPTLGVSVVENVHSMDKFG